MREEVHRACVGPLQVLNHHQCRALPACLLQWGLKPVEQPKFARRPGGWVACPSHRIISEWCGEHAAISANKPRNVITIDEHAEGVEDRLVRNRLVELDAAPSKGSPTSRGPLLCHPFGEPGLPYACLAQEQEPSTTACYCGVKEGRNSLPFVTPAHERRSFRLNGRRCWNLRFAGAADMRGTLHLRKKRYRFRVWLYAQFRSGKSGEAPELADGGRFVAGSNEKLHEAALCRFVERIGIRGSPRILNCQIQPPPMVKPLGQSLKRRDETLLQVLSLKLAPLDIPILQQVPFVVLKGVDRSGKVLQPGSWLTGMQHALPELLNIDLAQVHVEPH